LDKAAAEGGSIIDFIDKEIETVETAIEEEDKKKLVGGEDVLDSEETEVDPNAETTIVEPNPAIEDGAQVIFWVDGDRKTGIVKSSEKVPGGINYKVESDGENIEITDDDLEA
jgi:hypothetical protein